MPRVVSMNVLYPAWNITFGRPHELVENDGQPERARDAAPAGRAEAVRARTNPRS